MSTKYKHSHEVPTSVLAKRLGELSDAVGKRGEDRDRELTRRVPAELDRDADLVLSEAAQRLVKLEAERDIMALDKQAGHYWRHVNAMTAEGLHSKSDIAAELAYRDARIAELERERNAYRTAEEAQIALRQKADEREAALAAHVEQLREALRPLAYGGASDCIGRGDFSVMRERVKDWLGVRDFKNARAAFDSTPTTSLARRDAEQRGKALTETAKWFAGLHTSTELLSAEVVYDILMDQSRRQTEGHQ